MKPHAHLLEAMLSCPFKAWQLSKQETSNCSSDDPIVILAEQINHGILLNIRSSTLLKHAQALLKDTTELLDKDQPPNFYKIPHCSECQFKNDCHKKLKEKDCISLLASMTPKAMAKYHNKGITTITQLSYLFKPRRRRSPNPQSSYLWELKALAIREKKTFVIELPELPHSQNSIYVDFEGTSAENHIYLIGVLIVKDGQSNESFSFWSDYKEQEESIFKSLFNLLNKYPDTPIYHYGSYESKALKLAVKKWPDSLRNWTAIEKRLVNLLGYLRSHVYPPTYGNGLKEVGAYLNFQWEEPAADGFLSMAWRKQWKETNNVEWKDKLVRYNLDDCTALYRVHSWFNQLIAGATPESVQEVAQMKKHSPYRLQHNKEYGDDFQEISKAAYFDYQRNKVYWRNELKKESPAGSSKIKMLKPGRGSIAWKPKTINEVIIMPPLNACTGCGHTKLYQSHETKSSVVQTDLKFTASGIRQHVTEYRSGTSKCAKCGKKTMNKSLRIMHYGDNLFALAINYYVNYHISNEMVSRLIQEQYGIWISPMYLVMYKNRWWNKTWEPVATYIRSIVLNSPVIHIDETTIKLSRESGYVWVFATSHTVFYHYASSREVGFLQEMLRDYNGIIVSDFYPGYETLNVKSQKCLIHLIRDLNDDLFKQQFDPEYKHFVAAFSKLLRKIIQTVDKYGLRKVQLEKHVKDADAFYQDFVNRHYKSELAARYAKRFKKHWEQLWTFLHHDNVPWNNNNAEAAVKAFAQHRRGVKGQMHVRGITDYLQMLTIAQTCRYRNISFLSFLRKKNGIWENVPRDVLPSFLPFEQAKLYVHRLGFERQIDWNEWKRQGKRPSFIPSAPDKIYKNSGWIDWHDWIGFDFLPFNKARTYIRRLQLKSVAAYREWTASGQRPKFIPAVPEKEYKHTGWVSFKDYIGIVK
jgi:predicted RecB family nuclease